MGNNALYMDPENGNGQSTYSSGFGDGSNEMKILVVDDNPTNIGVIQKALETQNLDFHMAPNGMLALELAPKTKPDLILLDVMMPDIDGFETCRELKNNPETRDIPVIFLTAKDGIDDMEKGFRLGCVDYISKPFAIREVMARVKAHLRIRKIAKQKEDAVRKLMHAKLKLEKEVLEQAVSLEKAREDAEIANREKTDYLIKITHELKTPMNAILGFSQLIEGDRSGQLSPVQAKSIQHIKMAGEYLVTLINEVLDLEKFEAGRITLSPEVVRLADLARERVIPMTQNMAEEFGIELKNNMDEHSEIKIHCDPLRMSQILINLITNAIKYNREGGSVILDFKKTPHGTGRIFVADTGHGIPEDKMESIFKPFCRLETNDSKVEGLGVGLTITKRFVELMGARLTLNSKVGIGSVFGIEFPMGKK